MRGSVVDRVNHLLALAAGDPTEEARTAAHQAARLIRENGLVVLAADDPRLKAPASDPRTMTEDLWKVAAAARATATSGRLLVRVQRSVFCAKCKQVVRSGSHAVYSQADGLVFHVRCGR